MGERRLVRDLMSVGVPTCAPDTPVVEVGRVLLRDRLEAVVVQDEEGHAVGTVGWDEMVSAYSRGGWQTLMAEEVMRSEVFELPPDIPLTAAAQLMQDQKVRIAFLMHRARGIAYPAAMLSFTHLLRHMTAQSDDDLDDLGITLARENPVDAFIQKRNAARQQRE